MKTSLEWTFINECEIPKDVNELLVEGEKAVSAYKTLRDIAIFTDRRLIVRDSQGLTGKKIQMYSLPYVSILMWSTENAVLADINSEIILHTLVGTFKVKLLRGIDVRNLDKLMASLIIK